jgi:hypothetical protein
MAIYGNDYTGSNNGLLQMHYRLIRSEMCTVQARNGRLNAIGLLPDVCHNLIFCFT